MSIKASNTPFLTGYAVKPNLINEIGIITFTDGTNEITPNQQQCEAYGHTYNQATGTCSAFTFNTELGQSLLKESNNIQGSNNVVGSGTDNCYVMGESNTIVGVGKNNQIIGSGNSISYGLQNTNVFGSLGEGTADNSIVLGGNAGGDNLGERQSITVMFGRTTTDGGNTTSYMNNTTDSFFPVPTNTAIYFHAEVIAVRVGGSSGSGAVGDFASWVERGVVINKSGTLTISRERDAIKSSGATSNWQPTGIVTGTTNFTLRVRGDADMNVEWAATVRMTQMKTEVAL